jgi:hypothetical protein
MHHRGLIPAAQLHPYLDAFSVQSMSREEHNGRGERPSFKGTLASNGELRFGRTFSAETRTSDFGPVGSSVPYPAFCTVTASGPNRRPSARRRSASLAAPLRGLGSSQNKFVNTRQMHHTNFFRAPPRKHSLALGSRAHFAY